MRIKFKSNKNEYPHCLKKEHNFKPLNTMHPMKIKEMIVQHKQVSRYNLHPHMLKFYLYTFLGHRICLGYNLFRKYFKDTNNNKTHFSLY
jgi:hypothetical protein